MVKSMDGKVVFIGGGPGDPELLTLKAYNVIKKADVISAFLKRFLNSLSKTS